MAQLAQLLCTPAISSDWLSWIVFAVSWISIAGLQHWLTLCTKFFYGFIDTKFPFGYTWNYDAIDKFLLEIFLLASLCGPDSALKWEIFLIWCHPANLLLLFQQHSVRLSWKKTFQCFLALLHCCTPTTTPVSLGTAVLMFLHCVCLTFKPTESFSGGGV